MTDDSDLADPSHDPHKPSTRDRLRGAITKTRHALKLHPQRTNSSNDEARPNNSDIEEFLAGGRTSLASDQLSIERPASSRDEELRPPATPPRPSVENTANNPSLHQSPRRLVVPKIDVSGSQRWPRAKPIEAGHNQRQDQHQNNDFLRPRDQARSQSTSALAKGGPRARGLSVSFINAPPVVIGEGGDKAEMPTMEISRAKQRAKSVSPVGHRPVEGGHHVPLPTWHANLPLKSVGDGLHLSFDARPAQRTQAGVMPLGKEFEMTLQGDTGRANAAPLPYPQSQSLPLAAPKPIRPPTSYTAIEAGRLTNSSSTIRAVDSSDSFRDQRDDAQSDVASHPFKTRQSPSPNSISRKPLPPGSPLHGSPLPSPRVAFPAPDHAVNAHPSTVKPQLIVPQHVGPVGSTRGHTPSPTSAQNVQSVPDASSTHDATSFAQRMAAQGGRFYEGLN